jgi:hypothetical protein
MTRRKERRRAGLGKRNESAHTKCRRADRAAFQDSSTLNWGSIAMALETSGGMRMFRGRNCCGVTVGAGGATDGVLAVGSSRKNFVNDTSSVLQFEHSIASIYRPNNLDQNFHHGVGTRLRFRVSFTLILPPSFTPPVSIPCGSMTHNRVLAIKHRWRVRPQRGHDASLDISDLQN